MPAKRWTPTECAAALRITDRHLRRLVADQVLAQHPAGGFDPVATCLAFIAHLQKDEDTKSARRELMQVEAQRKRIAMRRHLGELVTRDELTAFGTDIWVRTLGAWNASTSYLYYGLAGHVDEMTQRVIAGKAADGGLYEMNRLRADLEVKLKDMRRDLRDEERVEQLLSELAASQEPVEQADGET